jgi:diketogulonate reductase-like aldo/keto reductase
MAAIPTVTLVSGLAVPVLGQGTWRMGERAGEAKREEAALRLGIELGMTLIDTAEMYGSGGSERVVAAAIAGQRDKVQLVSKVMPSNAGYNRTIASCEASLRRLGTDHLDLYLLHWPSHTPVGDTVDAFETLKAQGKIANWGVSNFDVAEMEEVAALPAGANCATNQILLSLEARGPEFDLLPWCTRHRMPVMAYSPLGQGPLVREADIRRIAGKHATSAAAVALAFLLARPGIIAIPKAASEAHVRENRAAADLTLDAEDLKALDAAFPPPRRKQPLDMI